MQLLPPNKLHNANVFCLKIQPLLCLNPPMGSHTCVRFLFVCFSCFKKIKNEFANLICEPEYQKKEAKGKKHTTSMPGKWLIDRNKFDRFYLQLIVSQ